MRILFAGGGSIGHIAPSVAVFREVQRLDPGAKGHFICSTSREDAAFLEKEKLPYSQIVRPRVSVRLPYQLWKAAKATREILATFRPQVIFTKGGSLTVPVAREAAKLGIPIVLHESDAVSGRANRIISASAQVICTGFPPQDNDSAFGLRKRGSANAERVMYTGNPVRPEVTAGSAEKAYRLTGFNGRRPVLLVYGGSQGAQALNQIVWDKLDDLLELCDIIHITGRGKEGEKRELAGYYPRAFAHDDLPHFYAIADLAISRAGAGSISELATCGIPSILVPLRGVAHDHQMINATVAAKTGGFLVADQKELKKSIVSMVRDLFQYPHRREEMSHLIRRLAVPDAATHIAQILLDLAQRNTRSL
ncbi:MAG: UDP-N-acetylglucosamine--N-acetylmuramyl-(pentapeptide) pyrophosphoryl-UDP N-acetylglucosamine [Candidatus Peribacteria bacterium]|nr:UDP-N-acetylglucosamine--N-acetylmuramyl-(pentapeptide) pyrophosphoryl-UDP N-acetylglucosamine [Candidatus Peribacteria bacterium]